MLETILLIILTILYLGSFIGRNILVKRRIKQPVRSRDPLIAVSIVIATLSFFVVILSTYSEQHYFYMMQISLLRKPFILYIGFFFFGASIVFGWFVSSQLKDSWRVGVIENQKTKLIEDDIYAYIRNPYFLSYYIMFSSLFFIRPSIVLLVLVMNHYINFSSICIERGKAFVQDTW